MGLARRDVPRTVGRVADLLDQKGAMGLMREGGWRVGPRARHGVKMVMAGRRPVILPLHHGQPYGKSLTRAIVRQAGLDPKEVRAWNSR